MRKYPTVGKKYEELGDADYSDVFDPPIPLTISPTLGAREFDEIKL
jgi:hypothetical protein